MLYTKDVSGLDCTATTISPMVQIDLIVQQICQRCVSFSIWRVVCDSPSLDSIGKSLLVYTNSSVYVLVCIYVYYLIVVCMTSVLDILCVVQCTISTALFVVIFIT